MEIELRHRIERCHIEAREGHLARPLLKNERACLGPGQPLARVALDKSFDLGNSRLKLGKAHLDIGEGRQFLDAKPRRQTSREIASQLNLPCEGKHIGIEAEIEERLGLDIMLGAMGLGLGQKPRQGRKAACQGRDHIVIHLGFLVRIRTRADPPSTMNLTQFAEVRAKYAGLIPRGTNA